MAGGMRDAQDYQKLIDSLESRAASREIRQVISQLRRDQHERFAAALRLEQIEDRLRMAVDASGMGIWDWDLTTGKLHWSENKIKIFGFDPHVTPRVETFFAAIHPDDRAAAKQAVEQAKLNGKEYHHNYRIIRNGEIRYISSTGRFYYDNNGKPIRMMGALMDVTDREIGKRLRESETKLRLIIENATEIIFSVDAEGKLTFLNPAWEKITGYTIEQGLGKSFRDFFLEKDHPGCNDVHRKLLIGEMEQLTEEAWFKAAGGRTIWLEITARTARDEWGNIIGVTGTAIDRTSKKKAELALAESEERYRTFFNMEGVGCVQLELEQRRFIRVNPKFCEMTGYSEDELLQLTISHITHPDDVDGDAELVAKLISLQSGCQARRKRYIRKDRQIVWVEIHVALIRDASGKALRTAAIVRDITQQLAAEIALKEAREQAEEASRTKDEFFANISHELRSPLSAIVGWTHLLKQGNRTPQEFKEAIDLIEKSAHSQARLIEDMLDGGRIASGKLRIERRWINPVHLVHQAVEAVLPESQDRGIKLRLQCSKDLEIKILADSARLGQVLSNLLSNALKFTSRGGSVEVELSHVGEHLRVTVRDTGCGIAPEFLPKVFDRLAQAHHIAVHKTGGLGLGLHIAKTIVEMHCGTIQAESDGRDKGATFTIHLPASEKK